VAILDLGIRGVDGLETAKRIHAASPSTRVVIVSGRGEETSVRQLLEAGVAGFVLRTDPASELIRAVRNSMSDRVYISPSVLPVFRQPDEIKSSTGQSGLDDIWLSPRQREVLRLIAEGYSSKRIAESLNISESTVKSHRKNIMERLDIHDKVALTRYALKIGLIRTN
jgi:DNA-binding NarL/FixJ family response regulator